MCVHYVHYSFKIIFLMIKKNDFTEKLVFVIFFHDDIMTKLFFNEING